MIKQLGSRNRLSGLLSGQLIWPLLVCIGCAHRTPSILGTYRLEENGGFPLVIPRVASTLAEGDFQESALLLPEHGQSAGKPAKTTVLWMARSFL